MSAIAAYANPRIFANEDAGSLTPYMQQAQPRKPLVPEWASKDVGKYSARTGATASVGSAGYALWSGLSLGAAATAAVGMGAFGLAFGGLARLGYNILRRYKFL